MQQIVKFEIELFDVRTKDSVKIVDDRDFVRVIQINKNIYLNNVAIISFNKSKSFKNSAIEDKMKMYNYVKIKLETKNYNNTNLISKKDSNELEYNHTFYFSGFITDINKVFNMSSAPSAVISITVSDFANLFKTTFYTKNLVFLDILNQAIPELRLLNFNDVFNDPKGRLLSNPYSPNQMGFLFFAFMYFRFMYNIVREIDGSPKSTPVGDIFKNFKIFMPFDLDASKFKSVFATQAQTLILYKEFQDTAYSLFKYLYPEPIFEFNTYENEESVILMIRPTPFMAFDRAFVDRSKPLVYSIEEEGIADQYIKIDKSEASSFNIESFDVIESDDFGFSRVQDISASDKSVTEYIRDRIAKVSSDIQDAAIERKITINDLLPNIAESKKIQDLFYNIQNFNIEFINALNMTRSAQSIVNVIWTTPVIDTSILQKSGRAIVFNQMAERLGGLSTGTFSEYINNQFLPTTNYNPVFLWNYRNQFEDGFVSGDINYFGIREFEVKWNFMTLYENVIAIVLRSINKKVLRKIVDANKGQLWTKDIINYIGKDAQPHDKKGNKTPKAIKVITEYEYKGKSATFESYIHHPEKSYDWFGKPESANNWIVKNTYSEKPSLASEDVITKEALNDPAFISTLRTLGFTEAEISNVNSQSRLVDLIKEAQKKSVYQFGRFTEVVNGVISRAYRENEHLYDMNIPTVINTSVLPGMILNSTHKNPIYNSPKFRGYVVAVNHILDFNAASLRTNINLTRAASDDSGV